VSEWVAGGAMAGGGAWQVRLKAFLNDFKINISSQGYVVFNQSPHYYISTMWFCD
jgi:hypothetical protein